MPTKLRIGFADFQVVSDPSLDGQLIEDGLAGASNGNLLKIAVRSDMPATIKAETLLHEVLHQCLYAAGQNNSQKIEEPIVRAMSMALFSVLRDNPDFVKYLLHQE